MLSPHDIHHGIILPFFLSAALLLFSLIPKLRPRAHIILLISLPPPSPQIPPLSHTQPPANPPLSPTAAIAGVLPLTLYLRIPATPGPTLLILLLWHGLLIAGLFTANLTPLNAILLAIAPHLAWAAEFRSKNWPKPAQISLRFVAVFIPMLIAQFLAWRDF